jgi:hypothetical protein
MCGGLCALRGLSAVLAGEVGRGPLWGELLVSHPTLIKFPNQKAGITGLYPSLHDSICPSAWKDGRNVIFRDQGVSRMEGWRSAITGTSATSWEIRGMGDLRRESTVPARVLFYGAVATSSVHIFTWSPGDINGTRSFKIGFSGNVHQASNSAASYWSFAESNEQMIAGIERILPKIWANDTAGWQSLEVSSQFVGAKVLLPKGPFTLAMNTNSQGVPDSSRAGKVTVHWSSRDNPNIWRPRSTNSAGNIQLKELDSQIITAAYLGDRVAVYGKDTMMILSFLGAPYYFGAQPALDGIGSLARYGVVSIGRYNFGVSRKGFWRTDGVEFDWIDTPAVREFYFREANRQQDSKTVGFHNHKAQQVIWYFPSGSSLVCDMGLGYDYVRNVWTVYGYGRSSAIPERVFSRPIVGTSTGGIQYLNQGSDDLSAPINAYVETPKLDFGDPSLVKSVQEVRLAVSDKSGTLNLHVRAMNSLEDSVNYTGPYQVTAGFNAIKVMETGRFFQLKISSSSTSNTWTVSSVEIRGRVSGVR